MGSQVLHILGKLRSLVTTAASKGLAGIGQQAAGSTGKGGAGLNLQGGSTASRDTVEHLRSLVALLKQQDLNGFDFTERAPSLGAEVVVTGGRLGAWSSDLTALHVLWRCCTKLWVGGESWTRGLIKLKQVPVL
jgi:hypothetical protein